MHRRFGGDFHQSQPGDQLDLRHLLKMHHADAAHLLLYQVAAESTEAMNA